jgi:putative aldouronate transport system substrate-binding protein
MEVLRMNVKKFLLLPLIMLILGGTGLFAAGQKQDGGSGAVPEIVWYTIIGANPGTPEVLAEANKYLREKYGFTLKIVETTGDYFQKLPMIVAGQEPYDLIWLNDQVFYPNVARNAFLPLDDLLNQYGQGIKAVTPPTAWLGTSVNNKIYAVTTQCNFYSVTTAMIEKQYLDKYNIAQGSIRKLADLEPLLAAIKQDNPAIYPLNTTIDYWELAYGLEYLLRDNIGAVRIHDGKPQIVNQYATPEFMEYAKLLRSWFTKGYFRPDVLTFQDINQAKLAGQAPVTVDWIFATGSEVGFAAEHGGREVVMVPISEIVVSTGGVTSTMIGVSRTSQHPDKAMQLLNLMYTDKYLYNLISWGIEGKHYRKIDDTYIEPIPNSGYNSAAWAFGRDDLAYLRAGVSSTAAAENAERTRNAPATPGLGFAFDTAPVANEVAAVNAIVLEYKRPFQCGVLDPDKAVPEMLARIEAAGGNRIIAEMQKQFDAWKAAK